jgi:hypothetical protein
MQEITLRLAVEEVNLVLEALGNLPFARVFELVAKVQGQASEQIKSGQGGRGQTAAPAGPLHREGT